jgi:hypothetical protein
LITSRHSCPCITARMSWRHIAWNKKPQYLLRICSTDRIALLVSIHCDPRTSFSYVRIGHFRIKVIFEAIILLKIAGFVISKVMDVMRCC